MRDSSHEAGQVEFDHRWIDALKAKHRMVFDCHNLGDALPLVRAAAFMDACIEAYKAAPSDIQVVFTMHQPPSVLAFNDAAWAKYGFGDRAGNAGRDPKTNAPARRNIFASEAPDDPYAAIAVPALQRRGAIFLFCNNVLKGLQTSLARRVNATPEVTRADLIASFLPGVILVPAAVAACAIAQEHGCSYELIA